MAAGKHKFTLVIDPGHGGHDVGAMGKFSKEKDINLRTALAFGKYVERNCSDVKVIYTRKTDVFVTLHGRAEIANKAKADLFISIHTNSLPGKKISRGLETYTLGMHRASDNLDVAKRENSVILVEKDYKKHYEGFDPNSSESYIIFEFLQDHNMAKSVELAKLVQSNVCSTANRPNKGVKQAGFLVLRETSMPSCLIELGFISTSDEEKILNTESEVDKMARGIYQAFVKYKNNYNGGSSSSTKAPVQIEEPRQQEPELEIREVVNMKQLPNPSEPEIGQLQMVVPAPNEMANRNQQVARPQQNRAQNQRAIANQQNVPQNQVARPQQNIVQNQSQVQRQNQQVRREPELPQVQTLPMPQQPAPAQQPQAQTLPQIEQPRPAQQPQARQLPQEQPQVIAQKQQEIASAPKVEQSEQKAEQPAPVAQAQQKPKTDPIRNRLNVPRSTASSDHKAPVGAPVFMVQIFVSDKVLDASDTRLKGEKANYYKEGRVFKYTLGASTDYNEIMQLRKDLAAKFPGCFVVAFKNGEKMNTNDAIIEFKLNQRR
jgi:N-acetylmuramoyl-L-alanine amidase